MVAKAMDKEMREYLRAMDDYISKLMTLEPTSAKKTATRSLIRSGVLTKKGETKKAIVTRK